MLDDGTHTVTPVCLEAEQQVFIYLFHNLISAAVLRAINPFSKLALRFAALNSWVAERGRERLMKGWFWLGERRRVKELVDNGEKDKERKGMRISINSMEFRDWIPCLLVHFCGV